MEILKFLNRIICVRETNLGACKSSVAMQGRRLLCKQVPFRCLFQHELFGESRVNYRRLISLICSWTRCDLRIGSLGLQPKVPSHGLLFLIEMSIVHTKVSSFFVHLFNILVQIKVRSHGI